MNSVLFMWIPSVLTKYSRRGEKDKIKNVIKIKTFIKLAERFKMQQKETNQLPLEDSKTWLKVALKVDILNLLLT
jgi:hypothetical protein